MVFIVVRYENAHNLSAEIYLANENDIDERMSKIWDDVRERHFNMGCPNRGYDISVVSLENLESHIIAGYNG